MPKTLAERIRFSLLKKLVRRVRKDELIHLMTRVIPRQLGESLDLEADASAWRLIGVETPAGVHRALVRPGIWDQGIVHEVWHGYFLPWYAEAFRGRDRVRVLDIGAHIGSFSCLAARLMPQATVHAYEVVPENARLASLNVRMNDLQDRVTLHLCGLGATAGTVDIPAHPFDGHSNTGGLSIVDGARQPDGRETVSVPVRSVAEALDALGTVDLLKIDCEGSEFPILHALSDAHLQGIDRMIGEIHLGGGSTEDHAKGRALVARLRAAYPRVLLNLPLTHPEHGVRQFVADREPAGSWDPWKTEADSELHATWDEISAGA